MKDALSGKLTRKGWDSLAACKRHLLDHGYWLAFSPPGTAGMWTSGQRGRPALAIQIIPRQRAGPQFEIVEYPTNEQASVKPQGSKVEEQDQAPSP